MSPQSILVDVCTFACAIPGFSKDAKSPKKRKMFDLKVKEEEEEEDLEGEKEEGDEEEGEMLKVL